MLITHTLYFAIPIESQNTIGNNDYNISFEISGDLTNPEIGRYITSGSLKIDVTTDLSANSSEYKINYEASIPTVSIAGSAIIQENLSSKKLEFLSEKSGILGIIWNSFSNYSTNDVYSIFHITDYEIANESFKLLNFTSAQIKPFKLFAPKLAKSIETFRISIDRPSTQFIHLFFDVTFFRLVGIQAKVVQPVDDQLYILNLNAIVSRVSFPLVKAELELIFVVINSLIAGIIAISVIVVVFGKLRKTSSKYIEGGVDTHAR